MTIKEAILITLEKNKKLMNHKEIYNYIKKNNLAKFNSETPEATVSALLGDFIRNNENGEGLKKPLRTQEVRE